MNKHNIKDLKDILKTQLLDVGLAGFYTITTRKSHIDEYIILKCKFDSRFYSDVIMRQIMMFVIEYPYLNIQCVDGHFEFHDRDEYYKKDKSEDNKQ